MDKFLKPSRLECDPNAAGADKEFKHWLKTFQNFISTIKPQPQPQTTATTDAAAGGDQNTTTGDDLELSNLER